MAEIKILHKHTESEPFLVLYKPAGLPSAPLKEGDESALTQAIALFPELKEVKGKKEVEYGLLHRIDTATEGILLIASTQTSFDDLSLQQKNGLFEKSYLAEVEYKGPDVKKSFTIVSKFRPFGEKGAMVKPVFEKGSTADLKKAGTKLYSTKITIKGRKADCSITEGYRHQVRAHLASAGFPIKGDKLYNPQYKEGQKLCFKAYRIKFTNPQNKENCVFECSDL